jgi:hypothetical protein
MEYPHVDFPELTAEHLRDARLFADRIDLVTSLSHLEGGVIAEVGVAGGDFSEVLLETFSPARFVGFDTFDLHEVESIWGIPSHVYLQGMAHLDFYKRRLAPWGSRVVAEVGLAHIGLARYPDKTFDLIYLDAASEYEEVRLEADAAKTKVKDDGYLIFNMYKMYDHLLGEPYGVVPVVNSLVVEEGWRVVGFALEKHLFCSIALQR